MIGLAAPLSLSLSLVFFCLFVFWLTAGALAAVVATWLWGQANQRPLRPVACKKGKTIGLFRLTPPTVHINHTDRVWKKGGVCVVPTATLCVERTDWERRRQTLSERERERKRKPLEDDRKKKNACKQVIKLTNLAKVYLLLVSVMKHVLLVLQEKPVQRKWQKVQNSRATTCNKLQTFAHQATLTFDINGCHSFLGTTSFFEGWLVEFFGLLLTCWYEFYEF